MIQHGARSTFSPLATLRMRSFFKGGKSRVDDDMFEIKVQGESDRKMIVLTGNDLIGWLERALLGFEM